MECSPPKNFLSPLPRLMPCSAGLEGDPRGSQCDVTAVMSSIGLPPAWEPSGTPNCRPLPMHQGTNQLQSPGRPRVQPAGAGWGGGLHVWASGSFCLGPFCSDQGNAHPVCDLAGSWAVPLKCLHGDLFHFVTPSTDPAPSLSPILPTSLPSHPKRPRAELNPACWRRT